MAFVYFLMETAGNTWVSRIRRQAFTTVLGQEKEWHDKGKNAGARVVADSGESLVVAVTGEGCVVIVMV